MDLQVLHDHCKNEDRMFEFMQDLYRSFIIGEITIIDFRFFIGKYVKIVDPEIMYNVVARRQECVGRWYEKQ